MAADAPLLSQNLLDGLLQLVEALEERKLRYALIGGVAAGYRSYPRFTLDLDFLVEIPQIVLPGLLDDLKERGFSFDTATVLREWTRDQITVVNFRGVPIDWLKPVLPIFQHVLDHAGTEQWLGHSLRIASAEGLILMKLLAFRGQDQIDIENLLSANRGQLDLDWIRGEWQAVAGLDHPTISRFEDMVKRLYFETHPSQETPPSS